MRILDRYLVREFLKSLAFALLAFVLLFILVDIFEKLDLFIDAKAPALLVALFYLYQTPYIIVLTLPVAMLLASLATVRQLARNHEIVAMKAAGISLYRIFAPLFALGFAISLAILAVGETAVPFTNQKKGRLERKQIRRQNDGETILFNVLYDGSRGQQYYIKQYNVPEAAMDSVIIAEKAGATAMKKRIDARSGRWAGRHWVLEKVTVRKFNPDGSEDVAQFDAYVLAGFDETPQSFSKKQPLPDEMGFFQLRTFINQLNRSGVDAQKFVVDLYLKISFPFANLIILIFGLPLLANARKSGTAMGFAISLLICFVFWGMLQTGRALGHNATLPPVLAAWLPNAVFGAVGAVLMYRAPK
ncbi:MAG: LptF/LptG family permease [Candidatus Edwardsbacteria bacterium]|nr:LptF/LptG family permease [Candidatus Edwardsbacteria bacterium]